MALVAALIFAACYALTGYGFFLGLAIVFAVLFVLAIIVEMIDS